MVQPLDFTLNVQDPLEAVRRVTEFGQAQALRPELLARERANFERGQVEQQQADVRFGQGNVLFDQGQDDRGAILEDAERQRQNAIKMQADLEVLSEHPTAEGFAQIAIKYPSIAAEINQTWKTLDKDEQQSNLLFMGQIYSSIQSSIKSGNIDSATEMLKARIEALNNTPGREEEAAQTEAYLELLKTDPESAATAVGVAMSVLGDGQFDSVLGVGAAVSSSLKFQNGTVLTLFNDGTRKVTDPEGNVVEGPAAAKVMAQANDFETEVTTKRAGGRRGAVLDVDIDKGAERQRLGQILILGQRPQRLKNARSRQ